MFRPLIFLAVFLPSALYGDLKLQFDIEQTTDTPSQDARHSEPSRITKKYPLTVVLGSDSLMSTDDHESVLIDFADEKTYVISPATKSYHLYSLYSALGFRITELSNRLAVEKSLAEGESKNGATSIVLTEHLLSLRDPDGVPLKPKHPFPKANYLYDKKPLFSCRSKNYEISKQDAAYFARFLRYRFPMHPDILAALEAQQKIPDEFDFYRYNFATQHFHFTLRTLSAVDHITAEAAIAGLSREIDGADRLCETASQLTRKDFQANCAKVLKTTLTAAQEKRYLDAALHYVEYTLSTNEPLPSEFGDYKKQFQTAPDVQLFFAALEPKTKEEAQKTVDVLHGLEAKTSDASHVLKIYEAKNLEILGENAKAQRLFTEALAVNPCMVGGWKNLGDNFYSSHETSRAWNCWNAGRHLLSSHPLFHSVFELEQKMRTDYPEFF